MTQRPVVPLPRVQEQELLEIFRRAPLALANWFRDGTLLFATAERFDSLGIDLTRGLAQPYQEQFAHHPLLVSAISQAFNGEPVCVTVSVGGSACDVRLFPVYDSDRRLSGVVGILVDATDRLTAFRVLRTLELLSDIRRHLAHSDSTDEFLRRTCETVQAAYPAAWIGIAQRDPGKSLTVYTTDDEPGRVIAGLDLSWDITKRTGRNVVADAIHSGRTHVARDLGDAEYEAWHALVGRYGWNSMLAVPLLWEGVALGAVCIHSADAHAFDDQMIERWERIVAEVTEGIAMLQAREERKRMLQERSELDENYKLLVEALFDVLIVHREGKVLDINTAGVRILGATTRDDLLNSPIVTLVSPEDRSRFRGIVSMTDDRRTELVEFRLLTLGSSMVQVEGVSVPIRHQGLPAQLLVLRDISERKAQEHALSRAKANLEYAQQLAAMGSIEVDLIGDRAEWSANAIAILGLGQPDHAMGFRDAIRRAVTVDQARSIDSMVETIQRTAEPNSSELRINLASGQHKTIQLYAVPEVSKHGHVPTLMCVVQDITRFREIESGLSSVTGRLLRAQQMASIGDFEIHPDQGTISMSSAACRVLRLPETEPHQQLDLHELYRRVDPVDAAELRAAIEALSKNLLDAPESETAQRALKHDVRLLMTDGSPARWISVQGVALPDAGTPLIAGCVQDVTDRKRVELELLEARTRLTDAERLARVWKWTLDMRRLVLTWDPSVRDLLGFDPPIESMTFDQFLGAIRDIDREPMRRAVDTTVKHGIPGEAEYIQRFTEGLAVRLYARWTPEFDSSGKVIRLIGASLDITNLRSLQKPVEQEGRVDSRTNLPTLAMALDRLMYFADRQKRFGTGFTLLGVQIPEYRMIKHALGSSGFYDALAQMFHGALQSLSDLDTYAKLDRGRFLLLFRVSVGTEASEIVHTEIRKQWQQLKHRATGHDAEPEIKIVEASCPYDAIEWRDLYRIVEQRLSL